MKAKFFLALAGCTLISGAAFAQATLTVPTDRSTIQEAIEDVDDGGTVIVEAGTYVEGLVISGKSVTVRGDDANDRPVIVVSDAGGSGTAAALAAGIKIAGDDIEVTLEDLIVIPASTGAPTRGIQSSAETANNHHALTLRNILFTTNDGADNPAVTDPFDDTTPLGTGFGADILYLMGRGFGGSVDGAADFVIEDCVFIGATREAIVAYLRGVNNTNPNDGSLTISGTIISRAERNPMQIGGGNDFRGTVTITGSKENPGLLIRNCNVDSSAEASGAGTVNGINGAGDVVIDHLVIVDHDDDVYFRTSNHASFTLTDSLVANSGGIQLVTGGSTPSVTGQISGSTFASNSTGLVITDTIGDYTVVDNIFSGAPIELADNVAANVTLTHNGLSGSSITGGPAATQEDNVTASPNFGSTDVSSLAAIETAFDVTNGAYQGAASDSSDLSGWGDFNLVTGARAWDFYQ